MRAWLFLLLAGPALADVSISAGGTDEEVAHRWVTALIADDRPTLARLTASSLAVCGPDDGWSELTGAPPLRRQLEGFLTIIRNAAHWRQALAQPRESALSVAHGETLKLGWLVHRSTALCAMGEMTAALFYNHHFADGEASFELGVIVDKGRVARVFWSAAD